MATLSWILQVPGIEKKHMKDKLTSEELTKLEKRLNHRAELVDIYSGEDVSSHLHDKFKPKSREQVPFPKQNLVDRGIRRKSLVFKNQPDYDYGEDSELPEQYDERRRWRFMKETERMGNLLGTLRARPVIRLDDAGKPYMDWQRLWCYIPIFTDNPFKPSAVLYPISAIGGSIIENTERLWEYWSNDEHYIMDSKGNKREDKFGGKNPYGVSPWVDIHIKPQVKDYWTVGYGDPLVDVNDAINVDLMEMRLGLRLNLLGQWYITGLREANKTYEMGVGLMPQFPPGIELHVKNPSADMDGAISKMKMEIENTMQNIGLHIVWGEEGGVPSGESLKVKNIEALEIREDDVANLLEFDDSLYEKEIVVWDKTEGLAKKLPENRAANYKEIEFPLNPSEQRDRDNWKMEKGIVSIVDIYLRDNPDAFSEVEDIDERRKKILEAIKRNQVENGQIKLRAGESPAAATNIFERREGAR